MNDDIIPVPTEDMEIVEGDTSNAFTGTVTDLLKKNKNIMCTFKRNNNGMNMEGTVYITKQKKMAGEFIMKNSQFGTMKMYTIRSGDYGYTWGFPTMKDGTKVRLDKDGNPVKKDKNDTGIDDLMDYTCTAWKVDNSKFTIPSDVSFTDITETVKKIDKVMGGIKDKKCEACNQIPDQNGKEQCKIAMGC